MNDIAELSRFVGVHAAILGIPADRRRSVLGRIRHDREGEPGSWAVEWSRAGEELERAGLHLEAGRLFNLARFPYADGPARREAQLRSVASFDRWRATAPVPVERLDVDLPGGRVSAWTTGLTPGGRKPVLLLSGGIVSVKEQFAPVLLQGARLGVAVVATEMPGVGENTLRYTADSPAMVSALLDAVADRADVTHSYALMMSFSGHLALRAAAVDSRLRGVVTAGAPVSAFFTDTDWRPRIPRVTVDTLGELTGLGSEDVLAELAGWALTPAELAALDIPLAYIVSLRDEIIPREDARLLRSHVRDLRLLVNDDVHGSPAHVAESRLWSVRSFLRMHGGHAPQQAALGAVLALLRTRRRATALLGGLRRPRPAQ